MATEKAEVQCVQTKHDSGIVILQDRGFACWPSSQLGFYEFSLVLICCLKSRVGPQIGHMVNNGRGCTTVEANHFVKGMHCMQYVANQRYKRIRLTTRVYGIALEIKEALYL